MQGLQGFDILEFDPLNSKSAGSYVDSVMATSVVNQFITTADVHNDKTVSNNKRLKRSLDYDSESDSCSENTKKLKPNSVHNDSINLIDGLSISPHDHQYTQNKEKVDDICELKSLVVGLASSMNQFCDIITKRMGDIETNIPKQVAQMIDQKVSEEMKKVKEQFKTELKTVTEKVSSLEQSYADVLKQNKNQSQALSEDKLSVVIKNLPETEKENISRKVGGLIKDGLRLKNIQVAAVERKINKIPGKHGVIIVKFQNSDDKQKVMEKKRELKDSRNYKDVYIDNAIPKAQRLMNSNLRSIVKAIGKDKLEIRGSVSCGFWNINGWKVDVDSEKYNFLAECVRYYNLHILGLVETHLTGNTGINIDGYTWFGLNRKEIHIRAKTGSGGVGILIRNDVRDEFNINIVEDNTDGIIWVKFEDKTFAHNCFYVCVIYLPPENSTRAVNIHEFFDILMTNIYTIPQGKPFYICGDWNSRCSDLPDSIEGIDKLPQRNVVDFQHNGYGNIFCDFLTDVNCCILNGRKTLHNDFTFVSTRGMSVVDYCVLPYEHLDNFNNFNVIRTSSIVEQINALGKYDLKKAMPDHSLLTWDFTLNFDSNCCINTQTRGTSETKKKYDTRNLPEDWLCQESTIAEIDNAICFLENSIADQSNIDNMYENFVKIVKTEMCNKLPAKNIVLSNGFNINKRRRCKKEWWNEELTLLWNEVCKAEKVWIKCKIKRNKRELRHIFVNKRRIFDKAVQSSKRKYWYSLQEDLIKSCDNPKEFWRKIGKIGVGSERRSFIPMEVKLSDESVSCDKNVVLDKWKCEFSNMLNRNNLNNVEYIHSNENVYDDYLDSFISYEEVYNVLLSSKNGKSPGCDEITVELFKNQTALLALTRIFNICFDSGKIPALWSKGIITPIPKSSTADPRDPMAYRGITLAPVSYKLYCGVLNSRLTVKLDELNFLHDEQNGFRKGRNTIDHISTLTTVIETRKLHKLSTYVAFIDFKKAYDWINRDLLFGKLENLEMYIHV
ncbi:unnamed protein product [Mytilus edulis]|uniref:Reverse transcriptase domain-containing protein n=1 Tax=Mytilus edulis TaxID=6550 RepID=A0A8S3RKV2_MYTED|nr:unnamed protein product [Mytilus edulis]